MPTEISIIIPTLNEADELETTLQSIHSSTVSPLEIIVVDAGSSDRTCAIAEQANCRVLTGTMTGRARQMNQGANASRGEVLMFLHGDTHLSQSGLDELHQTMENHPNLTGGAFSRRYKSPSILLKCTCWLADWRGSLFSLFLGDQVMFVRRGIFEQLKGFREMAAFEDVDFSRRMRKCGPTVRLKSRVISSARRFQSRGPALTTWRDFKATWQFLRGKEVKEIVKWLKQ